MFSIDTLFHRNEVSSFFVNMLFNANFKFDFWLHDKIKIEKIKCTLATNDAVAGDQSSVPRYVPQSLYHARNRIMKSMKY